MNATVKSETTPATIEVWITYSALSGGVFKATGQPFDHGSNGVWFVPNQQRLGVHKYPPGEWHRTEAEARGAVRRMIAAELRRLARSAKMLAVLDADVKAGWMPMDKVLLKTKAVPRPSRRRAS